MPGSFPVSAARAISLLFFLAWGDVSLLKMAAVVWEGRPVDGRGLQGVAVVLSVSMRLRLAALTRPALGAC